MRTVGTAVGMFPETFLSFWNVRRSHAHRRAELTEAWAERSCRASWTPCGLWPSSGHSRSSARKLVRKANLGPHPRPSKSEGETSQEAPALCMHIHIWEAGAREPSSSTASFYRRGKAEGCFCSYRARACTFRPLLLLQDSSSLNYFSVALQLAENIACFCLPPSPLMFQHFEYTQRCWKQKSRKTSLQSWASSLHAAHIMMVCGTGDHASWSRSGSHICGTFQVQWCSPGRHSPSTSGPYFINGS